MGLNLSTQIPIENHQESILAFGIPMPIALGSTPMRFEKGLTLADKFWVISTLKQNFVISRPDANTLLVHSDKGMIDSIEEVLHNLKKHPFTDQYQVALTDLTVTVSKLNTQGHPTDLTLQFQNNRLENTHIIAWKGKAFERVNIPAIGKSIKLELEP